MSEFPDFTSSGAGASPRPTPHSSTLGMNPARTALPSAVPSAPGQQQRRKQKQQRKQQQQPQQKEQQPTRHSAPPAPAVQAHLPSAKRGPSFWDSFVSACRADPIDPVLIFAWSPSPRPRSFPHPPFPGGKSDDLWLEMLGCMTGLEACRNDKFKFDLLCFFVTMGHMSDDLALRIYKGDLPFRVTNAGDAIH